MVGQLADGLFPGDSFPLALPSLADAPKGTLHPVGVVENLQGGLGPGANSALIERMPGVALDFDCPAVDDPH